MTRNVSLEDLDDLLTEKLIEEDLDYFSLDMFRYVAQDADGELCLFENMPYCNGRVWDDDHGEGEILSLGYFDVEEWPDETPAVRCVASLPIITSLDNV